MTFKDLIKKDVSVVFMNPDEFSDLHTLNGVQVPVQIDGNEQIERKRDSTRTWMEST